MSDGGETVGMRGDAHEQLTEQLLPPAEPSTDRRATSAGIGARSASIGSIGSIASVRSTASRNRLQTLANPFMARVEVGDALEEEEEHRPFAWLDRDRADSVQSGTSLSEIGETLWTKDFTRPRTRTVMRRKTNRFSVAPDDGGTPLVSEEGEEEYEAVEEEIIEEKKCHHIQSIQIAVTMFAALMSGTYYAYGLFVERLKANGGFTQAQIAVVGYMLDVGVFLFRPLLGIAFDSLGPNRTFMTACMVGGTGYLMMFFAVDADSGSSIKSVGFMSFAFILVGIGGSLGYTSSLFNMTSNFTPKGRSVAVSLASSGMGLSTLLVAIIYHLGFSSEPSNKTQFANFFLTVSILTYVAYANAANFAHVPNYTPKVLDLGKSMRCYKEMTVNPTFWMMAGPFALTLGSGLVVTNNTSSMVRAVLPKTATIDEVEDTSFNLVVIFAIIGVFARVICGQSIRAYPRLPAGFFLTLSCATAALGFFIYGCNASLATVYILYFIIGIALGGLWTPCITMLKMFAPAEAFGQAFGLLCCVAAIVGMILNAMAAAVYDSHAEKGAGGVSTCYGNKCYLVPMWIAFFVCIVACFWSTRLLKMKRRDAVTMHKAMVKAVKSN